MLAAALPPGLVYTAVVAASVSGLLSLGLAIYATKHPEERLYYGLGALACGLFSAVLITYYLYQSRAVFQ